MALLVFAMSCTTPTKEQAESTEASEETVASSPMIKGTVTNYTTDDTEMVGYLAFDANDDSKRPGILVVHEWWGHNDYSRQRAEMLAELGYVALAVDMYGDGKQAAHPQDAMAFSGEVMGNFEGAKARFESALAVLKDHPNVDAEKIGAIGYCFGGSVVLSMANSGYDLDAVAAFHAGLGLPVMPEAGDVKGKVLVAQGADDQFISEEQKEAYITAMNAAGADMTYVEYPGAVHAFTSQGADSLGAEFNLPLAYNAEADAQSWEEMQKLFASAF